MVGCDVDEVELVVLAGVACADLQDGGGRGGGVGDDEAEGGAVLEIHGVDAESYSGYVLEGALEGECVGGAGGVENHGVVVTEGYPF